MTQFQPIMTQENFLSAVEIFQICILNDTEVQNPTPPPIFGPVHSERGR